MTEVFSFCRDGLKASRPLWVALMSSELVHTAIASCQICRKPYSMSTFQIQEAKLKILNKRPVEDGTSEVPNETQDLISLWPSLQYCRLCHVQGGT